MAETKIIDERITHFISQMMSDQVLSFNEKILSSCVPEINQYVSCVKVYDWGESVDKLIINTGNSFINSEINKESFRVFSAHSKFGKSESAGSEVVERTITDIYFCDSLGNRSSKNSCYIAIELFSEPGNAEHGLF